MYVLAGAKLPYLKQVRLKIQQGGPSFLARPCCGARGGRTDYANDAAGESVSAGIQLCTHAERKEGRKGRMERVGNMPGKFGEIQGGPKLSSYL